jgi:hypothetical protein
MGVTTQILLSPSTDVGTEHPPGRGRGQTQSSYPCGPFVRGRRLPGRFRLVHSYLESEGPAVRSISLTAYKRTRRDSEPHGTVPVLGRVLTHLLTIVTLTALEQAATSPCVYKN